MVIFCYWYLINIMTVQPHFTVRITYDSYIHFKRLLPNHDISSDYSCWLFFTMNIMVIKWCSYLSFFKYIFDSSKSMCFIQIIRM